MDVAPPAGTSRLARTGHRWQAAGRDLTAGVALYFISGLITFVAALWLAQAPDAMLEPLVVLVAGVSLPISLRWLRRGFDLAVCRLLDVSFRRRPSAGTRA